MLDPLTFLGSSGDEIVTFYIVLVLINLSFDLLEIPHGRFLNHVVLLNGN